MPDAPDVISQLVARFDNDAAHYRSPAYNETLTRIDFINPMFKALGWDMDNAQGYADAYRDVIHEDALKIGGETKAPDYCFRIGGTRKFFLEAKKPGVDIKNDPAPAFQLRRYAWSAKLPLSVLTDFQEFAVYDCRVKPDKNDKASVARVFYCAYDQYAEKWGEIAGIFARESILKGSFDKYADTARKKRGTAEVDDAFLKQIEQFRDLLARNIALRNELSQRDLNFAVQRTIDRIIFLRICEDRGIEVYASLRGLVNGPRIYRRLCELYNRADERYNSGLFHFHPEKQRHEAPDELTPTLEIDDKVVKEIITSLYYPDSPYEFSVLGADILGQVYEQFLGKVIRLSKGGRATIEEKPEVRKAGGVYYTPTYIVDYIVANTVGKLLEGKTPKQAAKLRVLDPACGSGSFLIGAYQFLLDWHLAWYIENDPESHAKGRKPPIYQGRTGWRLTTATRKQILLNNIYGVDIDNQAVEVTKLSLLLKVLEGETGEGLTSQLRLFHERALPDLGDNIKCGNSLIGPDFYDNEQMTLLPDDEKLRVNVFDWNKEFAPIMKDGGFDAVIGNPPYVRQEGLAVYKTYLSERYKAYHSMADLYVSFLERGLRLLRLGGLLSYIVSSSFLRTTYAEPLRAYLLREFRILSLLDFGGMAVFSNAKDTYVCVPLFAVESPEESKTVKISRVDEIDSHGGFQATSYDVPMFQFTNDVWALDPPERRAVFAKIVTNCLPLKAYVRDGFFRGVTTGLNDAFVIDGKTRDSLIAEDATSAAVIKPLILGMDIRRYTVRQMDRWLIFARRGIAIEEYPAIKRHLARWQADLTPKRSQSDKQGRKPGRYAWYEIQDETAYYPVLDGPKIVFPDIAKGPRFFFDHDGRYLANTAYCIGTSDFVLLGILNSRLCWFLISNISIPFGTRAGEYRYRLISQYMEKVPIPSAKVEGAVRTEVKDRMVALVDQMLKLHERLAATRSGHDRDALQRQIDATDAQIDRLVYDLYGLTDDEIKVVEEATAR